MAFLKVKEYIAMAPEGENSALEGENSAPHWQPTTHNREPIPQLINLYKQRNAVTPFFAIFAILNLKLQL